jgi:P2-related tail formation protein
MRNGYTIEDERKAVSHFKQVIAIMDAWDPDNQVNQEIKRFFEIAVSVMEDDIDTYEMVMSEAERFFEEHGNEA